MEWQIGIGATVLIGLILVLGGGCKYDYNNNAIFEKLSGEETGITHSNRIVENDSINVVDFYYSYNGSGVGVGDFNNDGLEDIFFGVNGGKSRMYINRGDFQFDDVTDTSGIDIESWVTGISVIDINSDGRLDLYINVVGGENKLLINVRTDNSIPSFEEKAKEYGLNDISHSVQSVFLDYNKDGYLDMFLVTNGVGMRGRDLLIPSRSRDDNSMIVDKMYKNLGHQDSLGHPYYKEVSTEVGIRYGGYGLGVAVDDLNGDGWPDIYVANDFITDDIMYINQGGQHFESKEEASQMHQSYSSMGVDISDVNNDLLPDVMVVDMLSADHSRVKETRPGMQYLRFRSEVENGYMPKFERNALHLNRGVSNNIPIFSDISQLSGLEATGWSWSALVSDFDNSGTRDIFITNGFARDILNLDYINDITSGTVFGTDRSKSQRRRELFQELEAINLANIVFTNKGNYKFKNEGWLEDGEMYSTGAAVADLNNDGFLDIVVNNVNEKSLIYKNTAYKKEEDNSYLHLNLEGPSNNPSAIGSKVYVYSDSLQIYDYVNPVRGYLSSMNTEVHVGLGNIESVDSIKVVWPDGSCSTRYDEASNRSLDVSYTEAGSCEEAKGVGAESQRVFNRVNREYDIRYRHEENDYIDFAHNPLLPRMYSRGGPALAVGDLDGRHGLDFIVGGAAGYPTTLFLQEEEGPYRQIPFFPEHSSYEDLGILIFDADNDGMNDVYVVSGGSEFTDAEMYQDRLYLNAGNGEFVYAENKLPRIETSGSCVVGADFDRDGDLDLFVCGRYNHESYPFSPSSHLLLNQGGTFIDATQEIAPSLENAGMITSALWTDFNQDQWVDLIIVGEWTTPKFFENQGGHFVEKTEEFGVSKLAGWWNSIHGVDIDNSGEVEYVIGNHGVNNAYNVGDDSPLVMNVGDYDHNGTIDPLISHYVSQNGERELYPYPARDDVINQMPAFRRVIPDYSTFARTTTAELLSIDSASDTTYQAYTFESVLLDGVAEGDAKADPLPTEVQFAPMHGVVSHDFSQDGTVDLIAVGNLLPHEILYGWQDASVGTYLRGSGTKELFPVHNDTSGLFLNSDNRSLAITYDKAGRLLVLASSNADSLVALSPTVELDTQIVPAQPLDAYALITHRDGSVRKKELYYGSGYLSQSARFIRIGDSVESVEIVDFQGTSRTLEF